MYTPPTYTPTYPVGTLVTARPWVTGQEVQPQRGIVARLSPFGTDEHTAVWFPQLGAPEVGSTVVPIRTEKIWDTAPVETGIDGISFAELSRLADAGDYGPYPQSWPLTPALCRRLHRLAGP